MPIITVQRRMAEQGRIRLGQKVTGTSRQGKTYTRPAKLDRFRFTSPNQRLIEEVAEKYGGTAQPWDNDGKAEYEVITDATAIPVIVVKGGFSQWHELWSKAGCIHRCDGEKDVTGTFCDPDDPNHIAALEKPTTRLSVMLAEIETLGVWRMESKGWNAAAELPSMAELAMHVGDLVPATLSLAQRSAVIQVNGKPQTSHFVVPVLDLHVTKKRLVELVGGVGGTAALEGAGAPSGAVAIEAPRPDYLAKLQQIDDVDEARALWVRVKDAGHMTPDLHEAITTHADRLKAHAAPAEERDPFEEAEATLNEDGTVDAEVVEDEGPSKEQVWQQVLAAGGNLGMGMADLQREVEANTGHTVADASVADLQAVLDLLVNGVVPDGVTA